MESLEIPEVVDFDHIWYFYAGLNPAGEPTNYVWGMDLSNRDIALAKPIETPIPGDVPPADYGGAGFVRPNQSGEYEDSVEFPGPCQPGQPPSPWNTIKRDTIKRELLSVIIFHGV